MDSQTYKLVFVDRWPWWVGGPAIGLFVLAFFWSKNRLLGASSTYQAVLETVHRDQDDFDLGRLPQDPSAPFWRVWFWLGLLSGGVAAGLLSGSFHQPLLSGLGEFLKAGVPVQLAVLFLGGILIGSGTRMSGGCTSGHAITGISSRQGPSLLATLVFFATAMALTFALQVWRG
jgi:uncharacterized membrane protein YedE/YeeE